jgi:hypothetical protein
MINIFNSPTNFGLLNIKYIQGSGITTQGSGWGQEIVIHLGSFIFHFKSFS